MSGPALQKLKTSPYCISLLQKELLVTRQEPTLASNYFCSDRARKLLVSRNDRAFEVLHTPAEQITHVSLFDLICGGWLRLAYRIASPSKSSLGCSTFPVSGFVHGRMSNIANTLVTVSHKVESAKYFPGQTLSNRC